MTHSRESRPGGGTRTAEISSGDKASIPRRPAFRVEGAVVIDLRVSGGPYGDNDHVVERKIQGAIHAPAGADVTFIVSARQIPPSWAIAYLREEGAHLKSVKVQSDCPDTISSWWTALRGEAN